MPLIASPRHTQADLDVWRAHERHDARWGRRVEARSTPAAIDALREFAAQGPGYVGVSWGKDSVVVADLAMRAGIAWPLVWVRVENVENPDSPLVRDAFIALWPDARYEEITVSGPSSAGRLTSQDGFDEAARRHGDRYVSGVRGDESSARTMRMMSLGISTARACAPIGWWSGSDVFGYLATRRLPIHPAYACSFGGALERERIRVAAIGGERGTGKGRREWERRYYRDALLRTGAD